MYVSGLADLCEQTLCIMAAIHRRLTYACLGPAFYGNQSLIINVCVRCSNVWN
jgi:hypothetical protein